MFRTIIVPMIQIIYFFSEWILCMHTIAWTHKARVGVFHRSRNPRSGYGIHDNCTSSIFEWLDRLIDITEPASGACVGMPLTLSVIWFLQIFFLVISHKSAAYTEPTIALKHMSRTTVDYPKIKFKHMSQITAGGKMSRGV